MLTIRSIYCIPSITLYVIVVFLVYKEKQRLFGSFYSLIIIQAFTNIIVFTNSFYFIQLANETTENSWWKSIYTKVPEFIVRISAGLGPHLGFVQIYMGFLIAVNRMSFIVRPNTDDKSWKIAVPICTAIAVVSPLAVTYTYLTNHAKFVYSSTCSCFYTSTEGDAGAVFDRFFYFLSVFLALSSAINTISVVFLCKRSKYVRSSYLERRMLIFALLQFVIECSFFILCAMVFFSSRIGIGYSVLLRLIPYASDVMTLNIPYVLIFLNGNIRKQICKPFKCILSVTSVETIVKTNVIASSHSTIASSPNHNWTPRETSND